MCGPKQAREIVIADASEDGHVIVRPEQPLAVSPGHDELAPCSPQDPGYHGQPLGSLTGIMATTVGDSSDEGGSNPTMREPLLVILSWLRSEGIGRRQRGNHEPFLRDAQNLHNALCGEVRKRKDAICSRHKDLQKYAGIETELSIGLELKRDEIENGHHISTARASRSHIGVGCMKDLVVHASKAALSVQQVAHMSSPAAPHRQAELCHVECLALSGLQHGLNVASIAPVGPGSRQGRDIDRNSDLVSGSRV
jgi:hypothetical protein